MRAQEFTLTEAASELAKRLPSLAKHNYNTIDDLLRKVAAKHRMSKDALRDLFVKKFKKSPDSWVSKLDESTLPKSDMPIEENPITEEFIKWAVDVLQMESQPEVQFSYDTEEAQGGHHTGRHTEGENSVWVYVANRNMVDVFRTIFHEFVHVRQGELNMIKPGSSYPGSPIEAEADIMAGKYIKIFGKDHPEIFQ